MTFLTNISLLKKVSLLTAVGLIAGVSVFSVLSIRAVNRAIESMLDERLTTAYLIGNYIDEALDNAMTELDDSAHRISQSGDMALAGDEVAALAQTYDRMSVSALDIYLTDDANRVVWSRNGTADGLMVALPSQDGISGLSSTPTAETPVVFLCQQLERPVGGADRLVVALDVAQSRIAGFVQPVRLGTSGYVEIVDQRGVVVVRTQPGTPLTPFEFSDHSGRFADLIQAGTATRGVCHTCHQQDQRIEKRDVLAFAPLAAADWGVVVRQSEDEALAPARELRRNLLFFGIGLIGVTLGLVLVTTRDVGRRIMRLNIASQHIAEGDLARPVPACGGDEIGVLAGSLDGMRHRLQTSYRELEQRNEELSSLLSIAEILTSTLELPELLRAVLARTVEVMPGASAGVLLLRPSAEAPLTLQSAVGVDETGLNEFIAARPEAEREDPVTTLLAFLEAQGLEINPQNLARAEIALEQKTDGEIIVFSFARVPVFLDSNHHLVRVIAEDIALAVARNRLARQAEAAQALYQADRLRSEIIASVSHDLRTPLTFIKGYADSLLRRDTKWDRATREDFLKRLNAKTDELSRLVDKILLSAKLEAGAQKLNREPLLLPRLAQQVVQEISARDGKHDFSVSFSDVFPVIEADIHAVEQVLSNLLENAVKYSPDGGRISVSGSVNGDSVEVIVSDQGIGIPPEQQERIFERFYRVESKATRGTSGSGLGLSIARGHISAHGGRIWLESTPGRGSSFHFSLPLEPGEEEVTNEP